MVITDIFYTLYSRVCYNDFWEIQKETLFNWNFIDQPDMTEIDRTWAIASYQQNKPNPFVVDPTLFDRIYFWQDILTGDLNVDRSLDVLDLVSMVSLIINQNDISDELMYIIDTNQDEGFNVLDVVVYVQIIVGRGL